MSATKVDAMDDAVAACLPHLADVVRSTRAGARVKTPAYKAGVAVHEGASVVAETAAEGAGVAWRYAKFAGKFAGGVVVGTAGTVAAFAVGTVATGYETARDFAQGLLHSPNA